MGNFVSFLNECLFRHDDAGKIKFLEQKLHNAERKIEFMFEEFEQSIERYQRNCCIR